MAPHSFDYTSAIDPSLEAATGHQLAAEAKLRGEVMTAQ